MNELNIDNRIKFDLVDLKKWEKFEGGGVSIL